MSLFVPRWAAAAAAVAILGGCSSAGVVPAALAPPPSQESSAVVTAGAPTVAPANVIVTENGAKLSIKEPRYRGTFTVTVSPPGIVQASPVQARGPSFKVGLTAQVSYGNAMLTVTDDRGRATTVPVAVMQCEIFKP